MKSFQYSGLWWLPFKEGQKVPGKVTFTGDNRTKLTLDGMFDYNFKLGPVEFSNYPIILGTTESGKQITLFQCQQTRFHLGANEEQEYLADVAFIGNHFIDAHSILFNKVDVHYNYLPQWTGLFPYRGFQKPFDDVRVPTSKGTLAVQFIRNVWDRLTKETYLIEEADLPEVVRIQIEVQEALPLEEWMRQFITPLQDFISLATQKPNAVINIVGYIRQEVDDADRDGLEVPVQIAFLPAITPPSTTRSCFPENILFSLQDTKPNFSYTMATWLRMEDELDSAMRLFFGVQYTNLPLDLRFLLIAQAVEVYQDHRFDKTTLSNEEYQDVLKLLLATCPERYKEWLENVLKHSNGATFSQQLRNLVSKTNNVLSPFLGKSSGERGDFSRAAYNTRNYLTHHTKELAPKSASGVELFYITKCLSLAFQVCLMREIGFIDEQLIEILRKHEDFRLLPVLQPQVDLKKLASNSSSE